MPLPDYANPPVVERVVGVQFERLPKLKNGHLGAFWAGLGMREWPTIADAPPLSNQMEEFGGARRAGMRWELFNDPAYRIQAKSADSSRMVQLQNSRFHFNWIKEPGTNYPGYETVRSEFVAVLQRFKQFVADNTLGEVLPNQWEITYINHIPAGTVWNTPTDWGFFRPLSGLTSIDGLFEGESFGGEWHFVIPGQRGRLHINWQHGKTNRAAGAEPRDEDVIRLNLTARGPLPAGENALVAGLDLGHETIVRAFVNLMTDDANRHWGLRDAGND